MVKDLTAGKPSSVLWRFCLPMFGSIVFQQLYNIADSLVAGQFIGENALAAVGNAYEITLLFLAVSFGCNIGCSVIAAQNYGAKQYGQMKTAVFTALIAAAALCLTLMLLGFLSLDALLQWIKTPENVFSDCKAYLRIYILSLPFVFFYNVATGIFTALGDSKTPFFFLAFSSLANIGILPYFDDAKNQLVDLDYKKIQRYIDTKHQSGRLNGNGGLSARFLKLHKNIINQTLNLAVQNRLIPSNPCQFVVLPQCERYESKFYNDRQLRELFYALDDDPLLPLVKITALYGLRRSELLGLQWDSIDFERKSMTIRHTVSKVTEVVAKDKTKNASSRRTFPLTSEAVEIFTVAKRQEQRNRTAFGNEYQENNYVFKWPDGHTYSPDYVSHRFNDLLKKHNLPHIRFHELRHSCASMLIAMGWSLKDVQEWLGHSDVKMTANIYAHLDTTRKNNIAESLAEKFGA